MLSPFLSLNEGDLARFLQRHEMMLGGSVSVSYVKPYSSGQTFNIVHSTVKYIVQTDFGQKTISVLHNLNSHPCPSPKKKKKKKICD